MLGSVLAADPFLLALVAVRVGLTSPGTGCYISSGTEMVYSFSFCAVRFCRAFRLCGRGAGGDSGGGGGGGGVAGGGGRSNNSPCGGGGGAGGLG